MNAIVPAAIRLHDAAIASAQIEHERAALLAERAEMVRRWAIEDAAWKAQRNRLAIATTVDGVLLILAMLALIAGTKWLATLLLIACVPAAMVAVVAIIWPSGIYPWSRHQ